MANKLILALLAAFILCVGCKARKVALKVSDSTVVATGDVSVQSETNTVDKSKMAETIIKSKTDSTETITTIIPADGKVISVDKSGAFTGEAKSVVTKTKKAIAKNSEEKKQVDNDIVVVAKKDSTAKTASKTEVHQKDKTVQAKPNHSWIIYLSIGLLIIAGGIVAYFKFFK